MLTDYYIDCYRLVSDTKKPGTRQITNWIKYPIKGVLDTDSITKTNDVGKTAQNVESVLLSDTALFLGDRLEYDGKIYQVIGDSDNIILLGHHYETKVILKTGVTTN